MSVAILPLNRSDLLFLQAAITLAEKSIYLSAPNPAVGCLLVNGSHIIGRGWTQKAGENHAEAQALADALHSKQNINGATAYVSMEPCCTRGRTPACTQALIEAGVKRVVFAQTDPNPEVSGKGAEVLRQAGLDVYQHELPAAAALNRGFSQRMKKQIPWVRLKSAMSLDARTAMASGESQWITGESARLDVQHWRARSCAIVTGVGTVLADNPRLTVRHESSGASKEGSGQRQTLRVVLDSELRSSPGAAVYNQPGASIVVTLNKADPERVKSFDALPDTQVWVQKSEQIDLHQVLKKLATIEVNEVLVEAGSTLIGAFLEKELWDEFLIYVAPKFMGQSALPLAAINLDKMSEVLGVHFTDIAHFEKDIRIRAFHSTKE